MCFLITDVGNIFKPKYNIGNDVVFRFEYIPNMFYRMLLQPIVTDFTTVGLIANQRKNRQETW